MCAPERVEFLEDHTEPGLDRALRMQEHLPVALSLQPHREGLTAVPWLGFILRSRVPPPLDMMELCLAHDARESQQEPIMIQPGSIEVFAVSNQGPKERTECEQMIPITVVPRSP
jgi:hypothetical protein